jgi:purine nucleosidase
MQSTQPQPRPILIDTDIGDDVDDSFALALAARSPELQIVGVTTVAGPVAARAALAQVVLTAGGYPRIPVVAGHSGTIDQRRAPQLFSQAALLGESLDHIRAVRESLVQPTQAIDCILAASRGHTPLTILALGAMTNLAAALQRDPTLAQRANVIAMAGSGGMPFPDWNVRCDPTAARIVLASGIPITMVGMNITILCKLWPAQMQRLFELRDPLGLTLARSVLAWRTAKRRMPFIHDALAVAIAADASLAATTARSVQITPRGFSLFNKNQRTNALVVHTADLPRFDQIIDQRLLGGLVVQPCWSLRCILERLA